MNIIEHVVLGDVRGNLIAIEGGKDIPFEIKRMFYIFDTNDKKTRGNHAHYRTQQYLICVRGCCTVTLNDGFESKDFALDKPNKGLYQGPMVWGSMQDFSEDCVLLVLADSSFDLGDYITDFDDFIRFVKEGNR